MSHTSYCQICVKLCVKLVHKSYKVQMKATCSSETSEFQLFTYSTIQVLLFNYPNEYTVFVSPKKWRIRSEFASSKWTLHNNAETISEAAASDFNNCNTVKEGETET
jgi:hypothetical protein